MSHTKMNMCDRSGKVGDAPSQEEFCLAYRAQKIADQLKCTLANGNKNGIAKFRGNQGKGFCNQKKESSIIRDVPIIWRKHKGDIVKGSFCEMEGEWYWSKVACCGSKPRKGEPKNEKRQRPAVTKDKKGKIVG